MHSALLAPAAAALSVPLAHQQGTHWTFEPLVSSLMLTSILLQTIGLTRMGAARPRIAPPRKNAAYVAAMVVIGLALFSPIDGLADASFAWHMLQHLLLMLVAAPLLAASNAHFVGLYAFPLGWRRRIGRAAGGVPGVRASGRHPLGPYLAALAFTVGLWLWHAPVLYEIALHNQLVHAIEHLTFLLTAALFWRMVATAGDRRLSVGSSIVLLSVVGLQGNLMAALLTLAPRPLYAGQGGLEGQQLAGLIMWVPAGFIYLASTLLAIRKLLR